MYFSAFEADVPLVSWAVGTRYSRLPRSCSIQFLLRQSFADDEASTRLLQILLLSTASLMFIPCAVRSVFGFVARISLVDDLNGLAPIPAGRDSPLPLQGSPVNVVIFNSIYVYHVEVSWSYMPGGDHFSPGRVRTPVGPLGPPSPSGVLPTPASCVGQFFAVPGEPVHLA